MIHVRLRLQVEPKFNGSCNLFHGLFSGETLSYNNVLDLPCSRRYLPACFIHMIKMKSFDFLSLHIVFQ